jgi:hypothetical protein
MDGPMSLAQHIADRRQRHVEMKRPFGEMAKGTVNGELAKTLRQTQDDLD